MGACMSSMTLVSKTVEYDQVTTFHFKPDRDVAYEAGMMIHLMAPGATMPGPHVVRHMSFASAPREGTLSFSMDVASGTTFKKMMDAAQPGDKCSFFKVQFGHFRPAWTPERRDVVFLAGGIGITPIRSLIVEHGDKIDWQLIHVARNGKHLFAKELGTLGAPLVCTDHAGAAAAVSEAVAAKPGAWFYVCGSDRFMRGMRQILSARGVPAAMIRAESFH